MKTATLHVSNGLSGFKVAVFNRDFVTLYTPTGSPQVCDQRLTKVTTFLRIKKKMIFLVYMAHAKKMEDSVLKMIIHYL